MTEATHPDKGPFIREFEEGERIIGYYLLRSKQLEPFHDASRGNYLTLILGDKTGQIVGRVWENADEANEDMLNEEVVKLDGEVEHYGGRLQVRVLRVRSAEPDEYDIRDMLPASQRDPQEMIEQLNYSLGQITNPHLSALVGYFFGDKNFLRQYTEAPAAKQVHHAYLHGLLEHTLELLTLSNTILELYPAIDPDLLLTGILLHDIGKLREYTWDLNIDYTAEGRLMGHIIMTDEMISAAIQTLPDFPPELTLRLRHMLLSHHGRYEWGSPRRPKTLEAIALHHLDNLSAQINRFQLLIDKRPPNEDWTTYDRLLRRQLYGGGDDDLNIEEQSRRE